MDPSILDKRHIITNRIREDLIGPLQKEEILTESPTDAYLVGSLFPGNLFIERMKITIAIPSHLMLILKMKILKV